MKEARRECTEDLTELEKARRAVYREYRRVFKWLVKQGLNPSEAAYPAAVLLGDMCGVDGLFSSETWK